MTPPPDDMPLAVLIVRPDGTAVYVGLRDYQSTPERFGAGPCDEEPPRPAFPAGDLFERG